MPVQESTRLADTAAGTSILLAAGVNVTQLNEIAGIVASVAATVSAVVAIYYHLFKAPKRPPRDSD